MKSTVKSIIACAASLALGCALFGCAPQQAQDDQQTEPEKQIGIKLNVTAEGWDADSSTPIVAMFLPDTPEDDLVTADEATGEDAQEGKEDTSDVEPIYKDLKANEDQVLELEEGSYNLSLISPVNSDGSIYTVPTETVVEASEITDDAEPIELELIPADQVASEQMQAIITALTVAKDIDPDVVTDAIVDRATENAKACPNVSEDAIEVAETVAQEAVQSGNAASAAQATKPATQTPTANTGSTGGNSAASTPSGGSAASTPSAPSVSTPSTPSAPSAPAHTHNWVAQTTQKYVVDQPAQSKIVCSCGAVFSSKADWTAHNKPLAIAGGGHSYSAQGTAEQGHYETITTGYTCSCGATK